METVNDLLNYDKLKIIQNSEWFSFSLDSVLLANFVKINKNTKIIDFCSGNAPIPLFLSTKTKQSIIGVELQKEVYNLGKRSIELNGLQDQLFLLNEDVKNINKLFDTDSFDLITCNPPYFKLNNIKNINENQIKAKARHEISLNIKDIFKTAKKILKNNGKIALINRTDRLVEVIIEMRKNNIEPKRLKFIYPFKNSISNLFLIEGSKNGKSGLKVENSLIVHDKLGNYTKEVQDIFNGGTHEN